MDENQDKHAGGRLPKLESVEELEYWEKEFCYHYIAGVYGEFDAHNGTQSYLKVKPSITYDTARTESSKLLAKPNIKEYIKDIQDDLLKATGLSKIMIVNRLKDIAFGNITDILDVKSVEKSNTNMITGEVHKYEELDIVLTKERLSDLEKSKSGNLAEIKKTKGGLSFKMYCADNALVQIAKMCGLNEPDKKEITATVKNIEEISDEDINEELNSLNAE